MYGDFGCTMKKVKDPDCSSAGGTVKVPARSEQECEDQGTASNRPLSLGMEFVIMSNLCDVRLGLRARRL